MPKPYWTWITELSMEDVQPGSTYIMIKIAYTHWGGNRNSTPCCSILQRHLLHYSQIHHLRLDLCVDTSTPSQNSCTNPVPIKHLKTFLNTMLLVEYSVLTASVVISVFLYGFTATLGALITRITLNWDLLKNQRNPRNDTVQMEQLISNTENP